MGMLYCDCKLKWSTRTNSYTRKNRHGEKVARKSLYGCYYCTQPHKEHVHPDCPRTIGSKKADDLVWKKVCEVIDKPEILLAEARKQIENIQQQAKEVIEDKERLEREGETILVERQWVITQARKGKINDKDMDYQLGILSNQETNLRGEIASMGEFVRLSILGGWEEKARQYFEDLQVGLESLNTAPQNDEERQEIFTHKRQIVQTLIERVEIKKDRELKVNFRLNVLALLEQTSNFSEVGEVETYSRTLTSLAHPHHYEVCGSPFQPAYQSQLYDLLNLLTEL